MEKFTKVVALMIERSKLHPHPDNPRKNLGDLSELKESIRLHGIMQNLTVIPEDDSYESFKILIGHRRFAASEGILDKLPCVIVENLTDREQIGIMLCENLQRNDLTWYEQGRGFQMMLDLGDTIDDIKEKTGFSEKTIKHRVEIAKLSKSSLEDRAWQISLTDLMTLEKIKDLKKRQEILDRSQSSENLNYRIDQELKEERYKANLKRAKMICKSLNIAENTGSPRRWSSDYHLVKKIALDGEEISEKDFEDILPDLSKHVHTFEESYGTLYIHIPAKKKADKPSKKEKATQKLFDRRKELKTQVNEVHRICCEKYFDLIMEIPSLKITQLPDSTRIEFMEKVENLASMVQPEFWIDPDLHPEDSGEDFEKKLAKKNPSLVLLAYIAADMNDEMIIPWNDKKDEDQIKFHAAMTDILKPFGFSLPGGQEDHEIIEGTSPLYKELDKINSEVNKT